MAIPNIVIDAAFSGAWILPDEVLFTAAAVLRSMEEVEVKACVPGLWFYELANLLIVAGRRKRLTTTQADDALALIQRVPVEVFNHRENLTSGRVMAFAGRFDLSGYDAAYLELADRLQAPLHTADRKLIFAANTLGLIAK